MQSEASLGSENIAVLRSRYGLSAIAGRSGLVAYPPWSQIARLHYPTAARAANFLDASRSRFKPDRLLIQALDIENIIDKASLIVGRYTTSLACLDLFNRGIPVLLDVDDLDSAALRSEAESISLSSFRRWNARRHLKNVKMLEADIIGQADAVWVVNPEDRIQPGLSHARVLPNIPFLPPNGHFNSLPLNVDNEIVGCVASFGHSPNVEAVNWFLHNVWPQVYQQRPKSEFRIFGSQLPDNLANQWAEVPGVTPIGFIEHVEDAYAQMTLSICPVQRGAGTNIKVLESAMHNRLCILTKSAARGLEAESSVKNSLIVANSSTHMIEIINHYLENPELNRSATSIFSAAVANHYSKSRFTETVQRTINELFNNNPTRA